MYCTFQEILHESEIALLQLHCTRSQEENILKTELHDMLNLYPNNFFALSILAWNEVNITISKGTILFNCINRNIDCHVCSTESITSLEM